MEDCKPENIMEGENNNFDSSLFLNRDLSWIEFNRRVLEEAFDMSNPLLERLKFLSIFNLNLDEFFMIRVAGIYDQIAANVLEKSSDGRMPDEQLDAIHKIVKLLVEEQMNYYREKIVPSLEEHKVYFIQYKDLDTEGQNSLKRFFDNQIFPVLTPLAFDPSHPFPNISNLSLNLAVILKSPDGEECFARVKIPSILSRLIRLDQINEQSKEEFLQSGTIRYVFLGDVISNNLNSLFSGMEILESSLFRVTRDTDVEIQEDEADDLLLTIEDGLRQLRFGSIVRLEVEKRMSDKVKATLLENMNIDARSIYEIDGPLGLQDTMLLYDLPFPKLKYNGFSQAIPQGLEENEDIFSAIKKHDILLYHPYHSFMPVVDFIKRAAEDPNVLTIKQTLYRVGKNSPIVKALMKAAENGKQVTVLLELKARFDEENNISWARALERVGVHVVYGVMGLKTHGKVCLVVRNENDGIRRYVHLGTGNYNSTTTKIYTDFGLMTCREDIGADITNLFNSLTGYSQHKEYKKVIVAPNNMRNFFLNRIEREIEEHKKNGKGLLVFKMNALVDTKIIRSLYKASQAGVKINLIIRGICCLKPGLAGVSDNISVTSIVGRFLEHSRIYYFRNSGDEEVFLGSTDLMQRNFDKRVEILFPIEDSGLKNHIIHDILRIYLSDNVKARKMLSTGSYVRPKISDKEVTIDSQLSFLPSKCE